MSLTSSRTLLTNSSRAQSAAEQLCLREAGLFFLWPDCDTRLPPAFSFSPVDTFPRSSFACCLKNNTDNHRRLFFKLPPPCTALLLSHKGEWLFLGLFHRERERERLKSFCRWEMNSSYRTSAIQEKRKACPFKTYSAFGLQTQ